MEFRWLFSLFLLHCSLLKHCLPNKNLSTCGMHFSQFHLIHILATISENEIHTWLGIQVFNKKTKQKQNMKKIHTNTIISTRSWRSGHPPPMTADRWRWKPFMSRFTELPPTTQKVREISDAVMTNVKYWPSVNNKDRRSSAHGAFLMVMGDIRTLKGVMLSNTLRKKQLLLRLFCSHNMTDTETTIGCIRNYIFPITALFLKNDIAGIPVKYYSGLFRILWRLWRKLVTFKVMVSKNEKSTELMKWLWSGWKNIPSYYTISFFLSCIFIYMPFREVEKALKGLILKRCGHSDNPPHPVT